MPPRLAAAAGWVSVKSVSAFDEHVLVVDLVALRAEVAQTGAALGDGLLHGADRERLALVQAGAVLMRVVDLAERRPVDLLVAEHLHGGLLLLGGDGVEVVAGQAADQQRDDRNDRADRFRLLVEILVREQKDDQRAEGDEAAKSIPSTKSEVLYILVSRNL